MRSFALACITCQRDSGCCARIADYEPIHQAVQASSLENCAGYYSSGQNSGVHPRIATIWSNGIDSMLCFVMCANLYYSVLRTLVATPLTRPRTVYFFHIAHQLAQSLFVFKPWPFSPLL